MRASPWHTFSSAQRLIRRAIRGSCIGMNVKKTRDMGIKCP
jgi:hypothetical protein